MFIHQDNNKINNVNKKSTPYLLQLLNITLQYKAEFQFLSFVP